jgi:ABC-type bacteriocin/lantibiotic exporter with double-glycine peptidase domain
MPNDWLSVPALKQSRAGRCLPACVRMVLAYLGDERTENDLARVLKTRPFGTQASNVRLLASLGYTVTYGETSFTQLREFVQQGIPPIVFIQTGALGYWSENVNHAVVLIGCDDERATVLDPAFDEPQNVPINAFLLAWSDFDYRFAVVSK